ELAIEHVRLTETRQEELQACERRSRTILGATHGILQKRQGVRDATSIAIVHAEVGHCLKRAGIVSTQDRNLAFESFLTERNGLVQPAGAPVRCGQAGGYRQRKCLVEAMALQLLLMDLLEQRNGVGDSARGLVTGRQVSDRGQGAGVIRAKLLR